MYVFTAEQLKLLINKGKDPWDVVAGPAAATLATVKRLGWRMPLGHIMTDDHGTTFDLRLDPPIVVQAAVYASVRRWRLRRIVSRHGKMERSRTSLRRKIYSRWWRRNRRFLERFKSF